MSFEALYAEQPTVTHIAYFINEFGRGLGFEALTVDPRKIYAVSAALARPDFPHADGVGKASPFKKAANFFVWFIAERPILDELPSDLSWPELRKIGNHQNVVFAYHMAVSCLHRARLLKSENEQQVEVVLGNRIKVSKHFFTDLVEAYSTATPQTHFASASLLFEQLSYKANPGIAYQEDI